MAYDLLVNTNRYTGGGDYDQLQKAFERLSGPRITTDIRTNGIRQREGFGIIDAWKIIEEHPVNSHMVASNYASLIGCTMRFHAARCSH